MSIGFGATAPSTMVTLSRSEQVGPENFSVIHDHVRLLPVLKVILDSPDLRLDGFLEHGRVSTVIGCRYEFIANEDKKPFVVVGFEPLDTLRSTYLLLFRLNEDRCEMENQNTRVGASEGNRAAHTAIGEMMRLRPHFEWRALGFISDSVSRLSDRFARFDSEAFGLLGGWVADSRPCQRGEVSKEVIEPMGMQGLRNGVYIRNADRDVHSVAGRRLCCLLSLWPFHA